MTVTRRKFIKKGLYVFLSSFTSNVFSSTTIPLKLESNIIAALRGDKHLLEYKLRNMITEDELGTKTSSSSFDYFFVSPKDPTQKNVFLYFCDNRKSSEIGKKIDLIESRWHKSEIELELSDFGAVGDGITDSTVSIEFALNSGIKIREIKSNNFLLTRTLVLNSDCLNFSGCGKGKTIFILNHFSNGFTYSEPLFKSLKSRVFLTGFTIKRLNSSLYKGIAGPKGMYISNADPLHIEDVEECYGLGYGIHVDFSNNVTVKNCYIHDHKAKISGLSGTDGIHFYRTQNVIAEHNFIHDVGDDALSAGSFDEAHRAKNITFSQNRIVSTKGGIKIYSYAEDVFITKNRVIGSREGGVYITDDKNSPNNSFINNVYIKDNFFDFVGVFGQSNESGALRIRFWPKDNSLSNINNVFFMNNNIVNCLLGVSVLVYDRSKRLSNLFITGNNFSVNEDRVGRVKNYFIRVAQCDEKLIVENNYFRSTMNISPVFNNSPSENKSWKSTADIKFINNTVEH